MTKSKDFFFPIEEYVKQSNQIEGYYDISEADDDYIEAWNIITGILQFEKDISEVEIKFAQKLITRHQTDLEARFKGEYRDVGIYVGGRAGVPPHLVSARMDNWFLDHANTDDPLAAHIEFEHIHPFADGNGRTGRLIYWYQCLQKDITPIFFTSERRFDYYTLF